MIWTHRVHSFHLQAWWLRWLPRYRVCIILLPGYSIVSSKCPVLRLVSHIVVQKGHVFCELLVELDIGVGASILLLGTHRQVGWRSRSMPMLWLAIRHELWAEWLDALRLSREHVCFVKD